MPSLISATITCFERHPLASATFGYSLISGTASTGYAGGMTIEPSVQEASWPDGTSIDAYDGYKKWGARQWAWEFLRRNKLFAAACEKVSNDPVAQTAVAKEFGLRRFKHHAEAFNGPAGKPKFRIADVEVFSNLDSAEPKSLPKNPRLSQGQVLMRFDLSSTLGHVAALDAQLRMARRVLQRYQSEFRKTTKRSFPPMPSRVWKNNYLRHLRLLDLLRAGKSQTEALRTVRGNVLDGDETGQEIRSKYKQQVKEAQEFAQTKYLVVALQLPNAKKQKTKKSRPKAGK